MAIKKGGYEKREICHYAIMEVQDSRARDKLRAASEIALPIAATPIICGQRRRPHPQCHTPGPP